MKKFRKTKTYKSSNFSCFLSFLLFTILSFSHIYLLSSCNKKGGEEEQSSQFSVIRFPGVKDKEKKEKISGSVQVRVGERFNLVYQGKLAACSDCSFEWSMGERILSTSGQLSLVFCSQGEREVKMKIYSGEGKELETHSIKISVVPADLKRPEDVQASIDIYKKETFIIGVDLSQTQSAIRKILESVAILEKYVREENACDVEAVYALTLGKVVTVLSELNNLIQGLFLGKLTVNDIKLIIDGVAKPSKEILESVVNADVITSDFSFRVNRLAVYVIRDYPQTEIVEKLYIDLTGEHDATDLYFLTSLVEFVVGVFDVIFAYNLAIDFILRLPQEVLNRISSENISLLKAILEIFIEELSKNPGFLGLSVDAPVRLKDAQSEFYNAFINLQRMFDSLKNETDDQSDDIIRYWDCGKDNVCPGDLREDFADINSNGNYDNGEPYLDLNRNGVWNDAWQKPDEGEGDGRYTIGEIIGTDKIQTTGSPEGVRLVFSNSNIRNTVYNAIFNVKIFNLIADNIKGPGVFNLGKILGTTNENLRNLACSAGIPFPEIRLWEFFVSPTALRDMLPLWDVNTKSIIIQRDTEPFKDAGYDKKFSWEYPEFHPLSNSDPDKDDVNPNSNETDGIDNDDDGKCANDEAFRAWNDYYKNGLTPTSPRDCKNFVNSTVDDNDFGTEGNFLFDWRDKNSNKVPDIGDYTEWWDDNYGILNGKSGTFCNEVCGNNKFDVKDVDHLWPDGRVDPRNSIGPGGMMCATGPYRGDGNNEVIDLLYFLFQDPTFSGVLRFYKGETGVITNKDGKILTDNAILHRAIWKFISTFGIIENYPYR
jgi:hypothetical protein